jgi:hypothetical protein
MPLYLLLLLNLFLLFLILKPLLNQKHFLLFLFINLISFTLLFFKFLIFFFEQFFFLDFVLILFIHFNGFRLDPFFVNYFKFIFIFKRKDSSFIKVKSNKSLLLFLNIGFKFIEFLDRVDFSPFLIKYFLILFIDNLAFL